MVVAAVVVGGDGVFLKKKLERRGKYEYQVEEERKGKEEGEGGAQFMRMGGIVLPVLTIVSATLRRCQMRTSNTQRRVQHFEECWVRTSTRLRRDSTIRRDTRKTQSRQQSKPSRSSLNRTLIIKSTKVYHS